MSGHNVFDNSMAVMNEAPSQPPIATATQELHNCIRDLDQNLRDLISRLEPVLGRDMTDSAPESQQENSGLNPHSDIHRWLEEEILFVNELATTVRLVTRRVEV